MFTAGIQGTHCQQFGTPSTLEGLAKGHDRDQITMILAVVIMYCQCLRPYQWLLKIASDRLLPEMIQRTAGWQKGTEKKAGTVVPLRTRCEVLWHGGRPNHPEVVMFHGDQWVPGTRYAKKNMLSGLLLRTINQARAKEFLSPFAWQDLENNQQRMLRIRLRKASCHDDNLMKRHWTNALKNDKRANWSGKTLENPSKTIENPMFDQQNLWENWQVEGSWFAEASRRPASRGKLVDGLAPSTSTVNRRVEELEEPAGSRTQVTWWPSRKCISG